MRHPYHLDTILQHSGAHHRVGKGLVSAIEQSVTFTTDELDATPVYSRMSNTSNHFEIQEVVAQLHHAEKALVLASGMAAISTTYLTFLKPGDHALVMENGYGTTQSLFKSLLPRLG